MWEPIIEKILSKYLSPYVYGLERDKLTFGLLSGELELNDFFIRQEVTELFDLPFTIDYGRIGSLKLSLPWGKWFSASFNLSVKAKALTLFVCPRKYAATSEGSLTHDEMAAQIITQLRNAKLQQVKHREGQAVDLWRSSAEDTTQQANQNEGGNSFSVRMLQRILRGVTFDVEDIHVCFRDPTRNICAGVKLSTVSIYNTDNHWNRIVTAPTEHSSSGTLFKATSLKGLSIYYGQAFMETQRSASPRQSAEEMTFQEADNSASPSATSNRVSGSPLRDISEGGLMTDPSARIRHQAVSIAYDHLAESIIRVVSSSKQEASVTLPIGVDPVTGRFVSHRLATISSSFGSYEDEGLSELTEVQLKEFRYVLKPLNSVLKVKQSKAEKCTTAIFEVGDQIAQGITIRRQQLKAVLDSSREAQLRQKHYHRLLMVEAPSVDMSEGALEAGGTTREEFLLLYKKQLQVELGSTAQSAHLTHDERKRLQVLHDVIPARYLIQWRTRCRVAAERVLQAREAKQREQVEEARQQQGWWGRITNRKDEATVIAEAAAHGVGGLELTDEEVRFIEEELTKTKADTEEGEESSEDVFALDSSSMSWSLTFSLPRFGLVLTERSAEVNDEEPDFLTADIYGLNISLNLTPKVDQELREAFEWKVFGGVDRVEASQLGRRIVYFQDSFPLRHLSSFQEAIESEDELDEDAPNGLGDDDRLNSILIQNAINRDGHQFILQAQLQPLVLKVRPIFVRKFAAFFTFEASQAFIEELRHVREMQREAGIPNQGFLEELVAEQKERLKSKVVEQQMQSESPVASHRDGSKRFYIDVQLAAPILIFEDDNLGSLKFNLGRAKILTPKPCQLSAFFLKLELSETQLLYDDLKSRKGEKNIEIEDRNASGANDMVAIHPIPLSVEISVNNFRSIALNAQSKEILVFLEPRLVRLLTQIPKALLDELTNATSSENLGTVLESGDDISEAAAVFHLRSPSATDGGSDSAYQTASDGASTLLPAEELELELQKAEVELSGSTAAQNASFELQIGLWVGRVGLTIADAQSNAIVQFDAIDLAGEIQTDDTAEQLLKVRMAQLKVLECRNNCALFTTITQDRNVNESRMNFSVRSSSELFQDVHDRDEEVSEFFAFNVQYWSPGADPTAASWLPRNLRHHLDETHIDGSSIDGAKSYLEVGTAPVELHWHKTSIQELIACYEQYSEILNGDKQATVEEESPIGPVGSFGETLNRVMHGLEETVGMESDADFSRANLTLAHGLPPFSSPRDTVSVDMISHLSVRAAAISFWEDKSIFWRASCQDVSVLRIALEGQESEVSMTVDWVEVRVDDRCVLAPKSSATNSVSATGSRGHLFSNYGPVPSPRMRSQPHVTNVLTLRLRTYDNEEKPYSQCIEGFLKPLTYVYFQQDLARLLQYLSGSILAAFLWKSYEAARELASKPSIFYSFTVASPQFVLSEDKSAIPQTYVPGITNFQREGKRIGGFRTTALFSKYGGASEEDIVNMISALRGGPTPERSATDKRQVDIHYLGSSLELNVEQVKFQNAYSEKDGELESIVMTEIQELTIGAHHHPSGTYKPSVASTMLKSVNASLRIHWTASSPVEIDGATSFWSLRLTRPQLSLLLDVMNENLSGGGYQPQPVTVTDSQTEMEEIKTSLEREPLKISLRMRTPGIALEALFNPERPVANIEIKNIYVGCDVALHSAFNVYGFGLYGKEFSAVDMRKDSINAVRQFLKSRPLSKEPAERSQEDSEKVSAWDRMTWGEGVSGRTAQLIQNFPWLRKDAFSFEWMRPGMRENEPRALQMGSVKGMYEEAELQTLEKDNKEAVRIYFNSCLSRTKFEVALIQPEASVLVVLGMDIFDFVTSGLAFSSMKHFPKPIMQVISQDGSPQEAAASKPSSPESALATGSENKSSSARTALNRVSLPEDIPFCFSVNASQGSFLIPSVISSANDIWRWQTDLLFCGQSDSKGVAFHEVSLPGGKFELLEMLNSDTPRLVCKSFELLGRGRYRGLFDPVLQRKPQGRFADRIRALNDQLAHFLANAPHPAIFVGEAFLSFRIPECVLSLTAKDVKALVFAVRSFMQDLPSAATGEAAPVVVPPIYNRNAQGAQTVSQSELSVYVDPSDQTMFRFFNADLDIQGLSVVFCDDFRATAVPLIKSAFAMPKLLFRWSPSHFLIMAEDMNVRMDYLNSAIGVWEPCVERLQARMAWRSAVPIQRVLIFHRQTLATQRIRRAEITESEVDPTLTDIEAYDWTANLQITSKSRVRPAKLFKFSSAVPIYINVTPRLVQLCLFCIPLLSETFRGRRPKRLALPGPLAAPSDLSSPEQKAATAAFRCLNMSGCAFQLTRVAEAGMIIDGISPDQVPSVSTTLPPSSKPISLDDFLAFPLTKDQLRSSMRTGYGEDSNSNEAVYILPAPPSRLVTSVADHLQMLYRPPAYTIEEAAVRRALLSSRSSNATIKMFEKAAQDAKRTSREQQKMSLDPAPRVVGDLPKGAHAFAVNLHRNSAVNVLTAFTQSTEGNVSPQEVPSKTSLIPWGCDSSTVAEIVSPHPSFKLLLIASTFRIQNHSGMPLQVAFLGPDDTLIRLEQPLNVWTAPVDLLSARLSRLMVDKSNEATGEEEDVALSSIFDPQDSPVHPCAEDWGIENLDPNLLPRKQAELVPVTQYSKPISAYPDLQRAHPVILEGLQQAEYSYSMIVEHGQILSVPPNAFFRAGSVRVVFRPLNFLMKDLEDQHDPMINSALKDHPYDAHLRQQLVNIVADFFRSVNARGNGWSEPIDSVEHSSDMHNRHRDFCMSATEAGVFHPRYCWFGKPLETVCALKESDRKGSTLQAAKKRSSKQGDSSRRADRGPSGKLAGTRLYFECCMTKRLTSLPAESEIRELTIFPSITAINASPLILEVELSSSRKSKNDMPKSERPNDRVLTESCSFGATLLPGHTFLIYDVQPPSLMGDLILVSRLSAAERDASRIGNKSSSVVLKMPKARLAISRERREREQSEEERDGASGAGGGSNSDLEDGDLEDPEAMVARMVITTSGYADCCLEVRKEAARDVSTILPRVIDHKQQVFVISAPQWFVDRTTWDIHPANKDEKPYIHASGDPRLRLLEYAVSEGQQLISLQLLQRNQAEEAHAVVVKGDVPAQGQFTNLALDTKQGKYGTFVLRSQKIRVTDTAGALSRIVTLVPKYIITNLCDADIAVSQGETKPSVEVPKYSSRAMVWVDKNLPLYIRFCEDKPYMSANIIITEATAGETHLSIPSTDNRQAKLYVIRICPDEGTFSVVIARLTPSIAAKTNLGVLLRNKCPPETKVMLCFRPYHTEEQGGSRPHHPQSTVRQKDLFLVEPGVTKCVAWPNPFLCESRASWASLIINEDYYAPKQRLLQDCVPDKFKAKTVHVQIDPNELSEDAASVIRNYNKSTGHSRDKNLSILVSYERLGDGIVVTVEPEAPPKAPYTGGTFHANPTSLPTLDLQDLESVVSFNIARMGISLVSEKLREELMFAELCQIEAQSVTRSNTHTLELQISDLQVDSQLERSEKTVILANRGNVVKSSSNTYAGPGGGGATRSSSALPATVGSLPERKSTRSASQSNLQSSESKRTMRTHESAIPPVTSVIKPPELEVHKVSGGKKFIELFVVRPMINTRDLIFKEVRVILDDIEVDMDIEVVNGVSDFYSECLKSLGYSLSSRGIARSEIENFYTRTGIIQNYIPPKLPQLVSLERVHIGDVTLHAWCSFLLDRMQLLGDRMIMLLKVVTASNRLELRGAPIRFPAYDPRTTGFDGGTAGGDQRLEPLRGSLGAIMKLPVEYYSTQVFNSLATLVGYSSLLNIPRIPVDLLRTGLGAGLTAADSLSNQVSSFMTNLTFDKDYINKRQRERQTARRQAQTLGSGLQAAARNLGEGIMSITNVVTKPIEGGRSGGWSGAFKGLGQGVMGSIIKPVDKVGQAFSHVVGGMSASFASSTAGPKKLIYERRRKPRMLWGEHGRLRDYDAADADIRELLGLRFAKSVLQCITLERRESPARHSVLVFYPKEIVLLDLTLRKEKRGMTRSASGLSASVPALPTNGSSNASPPRSPGAPSVRVRSTGTGVVWRVHVAQIQTVSASTQGVLIHLRAEGFACKQIPCSNGVVIQRVVREVVAARKRLRSEVVVTRQGIQPADGMA